jgi:hypothetical protein
MTRERRLIVAARDTYRRFQGVFGSPNSISGPAYLGNVAQNFGKGREWSFGSFDF